MANVVARTWDVQGAGDFGGIIVFLVFEAERCFDLVDLVGQDGIVKLAK